MLAVSLMLPSLAVGAEHATPVRMAQSELSERERPMAAQAPLQDAPQDAPLDAPEKDDGDEAAPARERPRPAKAADNIVFDAEFLMLGPGGHSVDTTRFARGNPVDPGEHRLDLIVNGQWRGVEDVEFRLVAGEADAQPCFSRALLARGGVDLDKAARGQDNRADNPMPEGAVCAPLDRYVPGAKDRVDLAEQKLYLTVPQVFLRISTSRTYVDPGSWDSGIPAARLNYHTNLFTSQRNGHSYTSGYAGLDMGLNAGTIRLRHSGTANWSPQRGIGYQRGMTYALTDLAAWRSQLLVGESATGSEFFDPVSFRGARISSDDRMLPDIYRYYAPVVRGTANSNARVTIHQRGYQIYETTVAPGPFAIDDLQAASYGGDLEVRVTEANGQVHTFTVPFATAVQLLRPGTSRFSATVGQTNDPNLRHRQYLLQGVIQYGLDNNLTVYGGTSLTERYLSGLAGAAVNTPVGAFAGDVTLARTELPGGGSQRGASYRLSYSKNLPQQGTQFSLLAYRYSTRGYLGLADAVALRDRTARGIPLDAMARMRNRLDASISQRLGSMGGNVFLTGSSMQYWNQAGTTLSYALGYSNQWRGITYAISAQRVTTRFGPEWAATTNGRTNTVVSLNLSIPLGREVSRAPTLTMFASHDNDSSETQGTLSASDSFGPRSNGSYNLSVSRDGNSDITSTSGSLSYRLAQATVGASVSWGGGARQGSLSASGGVLAHQGGVTLSQTLGETVGLIQAPQAAGARPGYGAIAVDGRGYAVVPNLSPYQLNTIDLDPSGMPEDVELQLSSRRVAPRAGAVVKLDFPTRRAIPVLIDSRRDNGEALPFAATAFDGQTGAVIGAVGQGSRLVIRTEHERGSIRVEWGGKAGQQCQIDYSLAAREPGKSSGFQVLNLPCQPLAGAGATAAKADKPQHRETASAATAATAASAGSGSLAAEAETSRTQVTGAGAIGRKAADGWSFSQENAGGVAR